MLPRELIGTAEVPGGPTLRLMRRGGDFMIMVGGVELMSSRLSGSEVALGEMACQRLAGRPAPHILIGGYGMGFTLRAVLAAAPADTRVTVAEIVPEILDWARGPMATLTAESLDDPRVELALADVAQLIGAAPARYDAILLDVDNGPDGLSRAANDGLYTPKGLARARAALRPGGVLAVWSAHPAPAFTRRLAGAGFAVDEVPVRAHQGGKGAVHRIWFARAP